MIQRPGYNNDNPLELKNIAYINKFGNYSKKKVMNIIIQDMKKNGIKQK